MQTANIIFFPCKTAMSDDVIIKYIKSGMKTYKKHFQHFIYYVKTYALKSYTKVCQCEI